MKWKMVLDEGAKTPEKAHESDAGFDLRTREKKTAWAGKTVDVDTGVHIEIPEGYAGLIVSKSGLYRNFGLSATGLIDAGYTGSIHVTVLNSSKQSYIFEPGDKVSQIMFLPIVSPEFEQVKSLDETERGDNGFGSSGR